MFSKILDRFEENLISLLMISAVVIIFIAVCQRYSIGLIADLIGWSRQNDYPWLQQQARSAYRSLSGINLLWAQELCIYLFVWMAKFGAAYGVRLGIHVGVDVLVNMVSPPLRKTLVVISILAGVLFTAIVAWIGGSFTWDIAKTGTVSPDLEIEMWIVYLAVPAGSALMCFRFLQTLVTYLRTGGLPHHGHGMQEELEEELLKPEAAKA
ncbi:MAG: TRAP transporter small permease [Corticimicrobacter sp.]|uniref:TRAP transporter small permease n=1 Tax=Corticimicrobacter sp. TaxID=2678536 RepID=UPI00117E9303|nr:TRAP transporter small permease [Alcaligenaceae bacterium SJ-26]